MMECCKAKNHKKSAFNVRTVFIIYRHLKQHCSDNTLEIHVIIQNNFVVF